MVDRHAKRGRSEALERFMESQFELQEMEMRARMRRETVRDLYWLIPILVLSGVAFAVSFILGWL